MTIFGRILRALNLTQRNFAEQTKISLATLRSYIYYDYKPSLRHALKIQHEIFKANKNAEKPLAERYFYLDTLFRRCPTNLILKLQSEEEQVEEQINNLNLNETKGDEDDGRENDF